jgi:hypothetical protein
MKLKTLKDWIASLPTEFEDMELLMGEYVKIDNQQDFSSRYDRPIMGLYVDEELKEIVLMFQSEEDINKIK